MNTILLWLLVTVAFGFVQGSFTLPMKEATRSWRWEHIWAVWSIWALLILPWAIALATVPDLFDIYAAVPTKNMLLVFLIGLGWGIGAITFGMGVDYLGIALGFAIIMGLTTSFGSLIPLFRQTDQILTQKGLSIIAGVMSMIVGIVITSFAGMLKEKAQGVAANKETEETIGNTSGNKKPFFKGLIICVIAGVCGSWMNIAFDFGKPIIDQALAMGVSGKYASNAVWSISLLGGFLVNAAYCLHLIHHGRRWDLFRAAGTQLNWIRGFLMGLMWFGSLAVYGVATVQLGDLGTAMGFAVFLSTAVLAGSFWGIITGEWKSAGGRAAAVMASGVVLILLGMAIIAWGNTMAV